MSEAAVRPLRTAFTSIPEARISVAAPYPRPCSRIAGSPEVATSRSKRLVTNSRSTRCRRRGGMSAAEAVLERFLVLQAASLGGARMVGVDVGEAPSGSSVSCVVDAYRVVVRGPLWRRPCCAVGGQGHVTSNGDLADGGRIFRLVSEQPSVRNELNGDIRGHPVQSGAIHGDVVFNSSAEPRYRESAETGRRCVAAD